MALKNEIGNIYGYLTVIARAENDKDNRAQWLCKCKCGNEVIVRGKSLRNGNTKSCGCYQKERAAQSNMDRVGNLVGQRFGKLQVISEAGFITHTNGKRSRIYNCLCDCGNYCQIQHQYLAFGDTTSCGCIRSKGEFQIEQLLKEHNINFQREYSFENLKDKLSLRFDFAIFNDKNELLGLIEYQGEQHYCKSNGFYSEDLIKHDKMKIDFCNKNNIKLKHIIYKKNYNLTWEDLRLEDFNVL
jgi:hypothetical protein